MQEWTWFWLFATIVTCFKLLMMNAEPSTDFEVHRNWLAITYSLPWRQWYFDNTSMWTLDYPPFFSYFERLLAFFAKMFDPEMLVVTNLNHNSVATTIFQKLSVIVTDFVFIAAVKRLCTNVLPSQTFLASLLLVGNIGLFMVDHVHFQYNGMLYGLMLMSIVSIFQGNFNEGAIWFTVLLNFKHIFLYVAPVYFIYMFKGYCFSRGKDGLLRWTPQSADKLLTLAMIVVFIFGISFGPFIITGQLKQVLSRLFPFKRGLTHAYWAPNVWALYNCADKVIAHLGVYLKLFPRTWLSHGTGSDGKVQDIEHMVLPSIKPIFSLLSTCLFIAYPLLNLWKHPSKKNFLRCLVLCAFGSFLFGWHVHEKAVILIIVPLSVLALLDVRDVPSFLIVSCAGHYSLFPLLFRPEFTVLKVCLFLLYSIISFQGLALLHRSNSPRYCLPFLDCKETLYIAGLLPLYIYTDLVHSHLQYLQKYEFIPLLMTSVYCAVGIVYAAVKYFSMFNSCTVEEVTKKQL